MKVAIITAGGAGMYCGSCMHDNTLAAALLKAGQDVQLIPTYTPIRTDEADVSHEQVFLGGINMYMHQKLSLWRHVPLWLRRRLDSPRLLNMLSSLGLQTDPVKLGAMTVSVLRGEHGRQAQELAPLADYVADQFCPDVVVLSNAMLIGIGQPLRRKCRAPLLCLLQGDDLFLDGLREPHRSEARELLQRGVEQIDGFLVHSRYYGNYMAEYLRISPDKIHHVPLGVELTGFEQSRRAQESATSEFRVGYFARICPEKGLHLLLDAFGLLRKRYPDCRLLVGGYLGAGNRRYFNELRAKAGRAGFALEYFETNDRESKIRFLHGLHVLSVPTVYREPKGIYVLEAMAAGIPVVQPRHGSFPEMIEQTGGGVLFEPGNAEQLAAALEQMRDPGKRRRFGRTGQMAVRQRFSSEIMAEATLEVLGNQVTPGGFAASAPQPALENATPSTN